MIDTQLLKACKRKDRMAQHQLYKRCFSFLMSVCIRYKNDHDEARAILNMGFLKILTNLDKYKDSVPFEAWSRRIMINTIIDEFRKNRKERENIEYSNFEQVEEYDTHIDFNTADRQFDAEELEMMIKTLPEMSQKVFNMFAIDGYSHKEISKMLNMSTGTSKWHVSSARKALKLMISKKMTVGSRQ
jgi:RNA polymerase sigma-70 factor (ECF subfamily)